jgi:hypothetical protein
MQARTFNNDEMERRKEAVLTIADVIKIAVESRSWLTNTDIETRE